MCQINTEGVAAESSQATTDTQYDYPYGLMNFQADCGLPGFEATVQQYFYGATENNLVARKYNPTTSTYFSINGASVAQQTIGGTVLAKATFQITDGGQLDTDGSANGLIVDPAGLGIQLPTSSTSTPTPAAPNTGIASKLNLAVIAVAVLLLAIILGVSYRIVSKAK